MTIYYVSAAKCTPEEPSPGWYGEVAVDDCGTTEIRGPYTSKAAALDAISDGAYSDWLADAYDRNRDDDLTDREQIRAAGRGHLLGDE